MFHFAAWRCNTHRVRVARFAGRSWLICPSGKGEKTRSDERAALDRQPSGRRLRQSEHPRARQPRPRAVRRRPIPELRRITVHSGRPPSHAGPHELAPERTTPPPPRATVTPPTLDHHTSSPRHDTTPSRAFSLALILFAPINTSRVARPCHLPHTYRRAFCNSPRSPTASTTARPHDRARRDGAGSPLRR